MKTKLNYLFIALVLFSILNPQFSNAHAQGALTPPAPPAPTMKSLDQIYSQIGTVQDQRTAVNAVNTPADSGNLFIISQPGSYYLTTNIAGFSGGNGIEINANNVTLDLNGFAVQGVSGSYTGIFIAGTHTNITVRNGSVRGWGYYGVEDNFGSFNMVLERLNVSESEYGIYTSSPNAVVRDCSVFDNTVDGIFCEEGVVSSCTAEGNGDGIVCFGGVISGCTANDNVEAAGIDANSSTVSGCTANHNAFDGIDANLSTVSGCTAKNNGFDGIYVASSTASGCNAQNNVFSGIYVDAPGSGVIGNTCIGNNTSASAINAGIYIDDKNNRVEDNHVTDSGVAGISVNNNVNYINNIIIKNSVEGTVGGTANNYIINNIANQIVGPIINIVNGMSSGTITSTSPWVNFSF